MDCGVQVISNDIIKPSSLTRPHPIKLKLSYLDKILKHVYVPLLFFYQADESKGLTTSNHLQISQKLKHSLLHILPSFYSLAGRLKHKRSVDCNDTGVEFVDARVRAHLKDVKCTNDQLKQYLPSYCTEFNNGGLHRPLLVVQITFFDCGGLVIAACFSHAVADLASAVVFLNAWAAAACHGDIYGSNFRAQLRHGQLLPIRPSLSLPPLNWFHRGIMSNESFMTERFVFEKEKIDILRQSVTSASESAVEGPTRVELVSGFIWKHFMAARLKNGKSTRKMTFLAGCSVSGADDLHLQRLVCRIRRSIGRVRGGYMRKVMRKESFVKDMCKFGSLVMMGKVEWCCFTSWRGFPVYEESRLGSRRHRWGARILWFR